MKVKLINFVLDFINQHLKDTKSTNCNMLKYVKLFILINHQKR